MKKIILTFVVSITSVCCSLSQNITIGTLGSLNNTWIFNQHVSGASAGSQDYYPSFGGSYGISGAVFFKKVGIEMNAFYSIHRQKYTGDGSDKAAGVYESEIKFSRIDLPLLLKIKSKHGGFFEMGPQFSLLSNAKYNMQKEGDPAYSIEIGNIDTLSFSTNAFDVIMGFGVEFELFLSFSFTTGIRFTVGLSDLKGVNALGENLTTKDPYYKTWDASAGLLVGIAWRLGKKD